MKKHPTHPALCASLFALMGLLASGSVLAQICTREYAPVCGQVATEPTPRTFANRCLLDAAQATALAPGECNTQPIPMPMPGSDVDAHGCKGSAGYQWSEELKQCVRPWLSRAITLEVAPQRRTCTGVIEMQCLMVRERVPGQPPKKWVPLFGEIDGFQHMPGKRAQLRVRVDKIDNPPADAPNARYTLLKVLP